ncbi:uncharacterized protein BDV17DRAFT_288765 [Aspergillus undulatus]|uniref:uncharacterized protein n=1 Tax=Aspergillus undulatus TaxID=1810928 RepID=UPI003CCE056C
MTRERRKWTTEEDILLRRAVQAAITESRPLLWREIAKSVPTRSNKDCRRRWCNSLSTSLSKGPWTESEDERLWNAVQKHGARWSLVSREVGSRNADQCSSHWGQTLNPEIDFGDWSRWDDETLRRSVERHGTNWSTIASLYFPKRTSLALRNRFNALGARRKERDVNGKKRNGGGRADAGGEKKATSRCASSGSPNLASSSSRVGYNDESESEDNDHYHGHEHEHGDDDDDDSDVEGEDEDVEEETEVISRTSRTSSVDKDRHRHRQGKAISRRSVSDESWMKITSASHPTSSTTSTSTSTSTTSMPFADTPTPPSFVFSQPSPQPLSSILYTMPEPDLDLYDDPSCWDTMMGVTGPHPNSDSEAVPAPGLLQEMDLEDPTSAFSVPFSYESPTIPQTVDMNIPLPPGSGSDQSIMTMHRISIDVECTSQQLPQIMNSVIATGGRVTMRLNHSSPDASG